MEVDGAKSIQRAGSALPLMKPYSHSLKSSLVLQGNYNVEKVKKCNALEVEHSQK